MSLLKCLIALFLMVHGTSCSFAQVTQSPDCGRVEDEVRNFVIFFYKNICHNFFNFCSTSRTVRNGNLSLHTIRTRTTVKSFSSVPTVWR